MNQSTKRINEYLWLLLLIIIIIGFFAIRSANNTWSQSSFTTTYPQVEYKLIDKAALNDLKVLKVCGAWPIKTVNLSNQRGNPFAQASGAQAAKPMLATSTVECVSLGQ